MKGWKKLGAGDWQSPDGEYEVMEWHGWWVLWALTPDVGIRYCAGTYRTATEAIGASETLADEVAS